MEQLRLEDDENEDWEQEDGVPKLSDHFIQKYLQGRDALVAQEKKQRSDRVFRENLSPMAAEACAIVDQIRFEEQQTLWTREYEESQAGEGDIFPGMMFSLAKERMEGSTLWKIVRRMPKGALLHCHLEAMVDLDWAIEKAFDTEGMHIYAPKGLATAADRLKAPFFFTYAKASASSDTSVWTESYNPESLVSLAAAAESFPDGGKEGFVTWVKSRCTITEAESLKHHHGINDVWQKFTSTFPILGSLLYYEPIFRPFIRNMCQQLLDDGVRWVELRAAFVQPYRREGSDAAEESYHGMFQALEEEVEDFKNSEQGKGFFGARMIWTTLRRFDKRKVIEHMKQCIDIKLEYPDLLAGYDLVGQEDLGRPLQDLTPELFWFKKRCMEEGVNIPFFFHAGETLGDGDTTDENLFDAVLLGTRRIGHGFSLFKHPLLIDMVKEKKILIESCPVSNEILRLTGSILSHPLPALLARGVPVALCNDDPAILGQGTNGMTHDFWQALQGWENLGLAGLGSLAENSVRYANYEDLSAKEWTQDIKDGPFGEGIRAQRLKEWTREWERFCQWIVEEYSVDEDLEALE
ncbi:hypothetical protein H2201_008467 [Coniosporium apollinis]|uniref:Adenosine deaminase domain-containing protein n=1 Tax=Coniosporium apollinis TaxID=61459 RepID=A0ABQ9NJQ0_9PEZI|nr:hypothetical protein H2201_008467 [Coniosporium apollinis]